MSLPIIAAASVGLLLGFAVLFALIILCEIANTVIVILQRHGLMEVEDPTCYDLEYRHIEIELENGKFEGVKKVQVPNSNHPKNHFNN